MDVTFHREAGRAYYALARRPDGVVVHLRGGSYNRFEPPLPHDIAHLVVERQLDLERGVWGTLEAGGLFPLASVHAGRQKPRASARGKDITKANSLDLNVAEVAVAAVCMIVHGELPHDDRAITRLTGHRRPSTLTPQAIPPLADRLREAAWQWRGVPVGGTLTLAWRA
ncbi:hypothetical protein DSM104299_00771 [Baekduia alba]|uniref:hypothetical protein n=1 Tax=Baekduia alba TaxID=2997333 RepID=UPI00233FE8FE|nr:hypothetical protein [Baekduia alba]WCB92089.1 hypothetical protein DSM104299_00771 [Baekduia alba]